MPSKFCYKCGDHLTNAEIVYCKKGGLERQCRECWSGKKVAEGSSLSFIKDVIDAIGEKKWLEWSKHGVQTQKIRSHGRDS
jgi:hypothetical protein